MAVRKLSPSTLKKLFAPFSISNQIYTRPVSNPLQSSFTNPSSISHVSQNSTKTQLFAKPFSSQSGIGNEAIVTQQRSNYVASGRAEDWKSCAELASDNEIEWVCWEKPEEGFIKVNVSVVFCLAPVKLVMIAGVYRDSLGHFKFSMVQPFYNPSLARCYTLIEYLAILKSVELAASEGYLNVVIESVNEEVVDTITKYMKDTPTPTNEPELKADLSEMNIENVERKFLEAIAWAIPQGGTYRFEHVYKEVNRLADHIAMDNAMKEADKERRAQGFRVDE